MQRPHSKRKKLSQLKILHTAVNSRMMTNPGRNFATLLLESGADLHFAASELPIGGWTPDMETISKFSNRFHGLPLPQYLSFWQDLRSFFALITLLRREKYDIIHTRGTVMGVLGRIAARLSGVPIVVHHQDDLYLRDSRLTPFKKKLVAFLERNLSRVTDRSMFISQAVLKDALQANFPADRCVFVGIDLHPVFLEALERDDLETEKIRMRKRLTAIGVPENAKIIGTIGRLTYHKGHDILIEAFKDLVEKHHDYVCVIKGNGPLLKEYQSMVHRYGLEKRIFLFTEELDFEELPIFYTCLDIFAMPTRREGFGMVFMEAMAMGIPTLGPDIGPVDEIIIEDTGILFEPENPQALALALNRLIEEEAYRRTLSIEGRKHAFTTWGNRNAAKRALDVYRQILETRLLENPSL